MAQSTDATDLGIESLRNVGLFADLPDSDLAALAQAAQPRHFERGHVLMRQGDPGDSLFVLRSGRAEVVITLRDHKEEVIDSAGPGDPVGELAVLTGGSHPSTVRALEPVDALMLSRSAFTALLEEHEFARRLAVLLAGRLATETRALEMEDPPIGRLLFSDTRTAPFWLLLRLWLGYQWLESGYAKITNPAWMDSGTALQGFWQRAVTPPAAGAPPITYDWYRAFIQLLLDNGAYVWFGKVIALGEVAVGLGLVLGLLTGFAATGAVVMNASYLLAGSASVNPVLAALEVPVILAWKVAGWWGLDRFILGRTLRPRRLGARRRPLRGGATPAAVNVT